MKNENGKIPKEATTHYNLVKAFRDGWEETEDTKTGDRNEKRDRSDKNDTSRSDRISH